MENTTPPSVDKFDFNTNPTGGLIATFDKSLYLGGSSGPCTQKHMRERPAPPSAPAPAPSIPPPGSRPIAPLRRGLPTMEELREQLAQSVVCRMQGTD